MCPRPPLPEVNRFRGRIGFEYSGIIDQGGSGANSNQLGLVLRGDMTRIGGSYWNFNGYTRIQLSSTSNSASQTTLNDLLNRTYHAGLTYDNPQSKWILGFGRMYLPWAPSLSTIDGGYIARRLSKRFTVGMFAGTTPDPTSWNYSPNRQEAGTFVNFEGGSWDGFKYGSTTGFGISRLSWHPESEFLFFENTLSWKRYFSVYHSLQADQSHPTTLQPTAGGKGLARSFLTIRFEPVKFSLSTSTTTTSAAFRLSTRDWWAPGCSTSSCSRVSAAALISTCRTAAVSMSPWARAAGRAMRRAPGTRCTGSP